jgi:midasin
MMRKRKAWIDLLQELKRAGLPSKLKPEVLDRQQNKVWLLDRLSIGGAELDPLHGIVLKIEAYFNRVLQSIPELRHSLSSHHGDLTTRDLQRAVTFVESSFALSLDARDRLLILYPIVAYVLTPWAGLSETIWTMRD